MRLCPRSLLRAPTAAMRLSQHKVQLLQPTPSQMHTAPALLLRFPAMSTLRSSNLMRVHSAGDASNQRRHCSTDAPAAPASPKIQELVDQISSLTLLEAAELTDALKEKLGISSAMMMPMGGAPMAGGAAAAPAAEEAPVAEKTAFTVKLESFDASAKIKLIKEVRALTGLGLKEAKEMVEKTPVEVKKDIKKEEAETIKGKLEAAGGVVVVD
eukprot:6174056-Pleurochrysis_carterae.AAC.2